MVEAKAASSNGPGFEGDAAVRCRIGDACRLLFINEAAVAIRCSGRATRNAEVEPMKE